METAKRDTEGPTELNDEYLSLLFMVLNENPGASATEIIDRVNKKRSEGD